MSITISTSSTDFEFDRQKDQFRQLLLCNIELKLEKCQTKVQIDEWYCTFSTEMREINKSYSLQTSEDSDDLSMTYHAAGQLINSTQDLKATMENELKKMNQTQQDFYALKTQFFDTGKLAPDFYILVRKIEQEIKKAQLCLTQIDQIRSKTFHNIQEIVADAIEQAEKQVDELLPISRMRNPPSPQEQDLQSSEAFLTGNLTVRLSEDMFSHQPSSEFSLPSDDDLLNFNTHLVGIEHNKWSFNFLMSDGNRSILPVQVQGANPIMQMSRIPDNTIIRRVVTFYDPRDHVTGFHFYDQNNTIVLMAGACNYTPFDLILEDGERIIGVKSTLYHLNQAKHSHFQFVIGKLAKEESEQGDLDIQI